MGDAMSPDTGRKAPALLAEYARGRAIALAAHATLQLIERPTVAPVPGMACYAHGLIHWQGRHVPTIDLHTLLRAHADEPPPPPRFALVLAWQRAPGLPLEHGALGLAGLPQRIEVADEPPCPLPTDSDLWPLIANSCMRWHGRVLPIIDTTRLFCAAHG